MPIYLNKTDGYICKMETTFTLTTINEVVKQFWNVVGHRKVIAFHGQMGSGKTTFIHALCEAKQVSSTVTSPTFSIINEYIFPGGSIFHIDLYRLEGEDEVIRAGVEDCLYSGNICLVEWPDKAPRIFPEKTVHVYIDFIDTQTRSVRLNDK
jgi:tRNA threonylcarbamoyladenosine biosynthesis protein TsaE